MNRWIDGSQKGGLTYVYENGNQLTKVTDSQGSEGFNNGSSGENSDYYYDGAGNATSDANRGIGNGGLKYNILNLPREISVNSKTLSYHYDATGSKVRMQNNTDNTKYAGDFEYNNGNYLTRIATEEEQISITNNGANASDYSFEYYLRDHLGNTRMVLNEAGTIVQETEYMPFGLAIPRTAGTNKYLYNGKEKQPETGLLDYGARQYDPTIGRWMVVDPAAEIYYSLNPFQYGGNTPLNTIDIGGKLFIFVNGFVPGDWAGSRFSQTPNMYSTSHEDYKINRSFEPTDKSNYWGSLVGMYNDRFRDLNNIFINASYTPQSSANRRYKDGFSAGENLIAQLKSGEINLQKGEKIKIVGHSQGSAYAAGIAAALAESRYGGLIDFVDYISPHQPKNIKHPKNVTGRQFSTKSDKISSQNSWFYGSSEYGKIQGTEWGEQRQNVDTGFGGHSVDTWLDNMVNYWRSLGIKVEDDKK